MIEAVCEFRFSSDSKWDWTIPGRLASQVKVQYPHSKEVTPKVVVFGDSPGFSPVPERIQLLSDDGLSMIQTGPKLLSVNRLAPYESWDSFRSSILYGLSAHESVCGWQPIERIGLMYVDRFEEDNQSSSPLQIGPRNEHLPKDVQMSGFFQEWNLEFDHSGLTLRAKRNSGTGSAVVLQMDAFTVDQSWLEARQRIELWIEQAHETLYQVFRSALKPEVFEYLEKG